ncbi:hypothetical protein Zm00014a_044353 [Zea mays]|uniref:Uncharacterized protein n=1 Tax=Zea mays TaxID=4577 RepID=A0A3L6EYA1_MAIZE|nr:hypothetical protein Zm00014a_044353 [Zea mays]
MGRWRIYRLSVSKM